MKRIADWLPENAAALIYTPVNRRYLTGFPSSLGYLVVTKEKARLFVDGRYYLAATEAVTSCEVVLLKKFSEQAPLFLEENGVTTVYIENTVTLAELESFQKVIKAEITYDGLSPFLFKLRSVKTPDEVACIVKAQQIAEKAFDEACGVIKPGISERDIAAELEYRMKKYGSEDASFETIAVSGKKSAMPHGVPDEKRINTGEFITMDFGAVYRGYHSDMTRTVAVGYVTDKMAEVYETVLEANKAAEQAAAAGKRCSDIDAAARKVIENAGYGKYFTHSTGHSVGLEIHESPNLSPRSEDILKAGNVVTDEPGIYLDGEFGVRIEDMLLITENGCRNLTGASKTLIIL